MTAVGLDDTIADDFANLGLGFVEIATAASFPTAAHPYKAGVVESGWWNPAHRHAERS
jgi:hypothetical protein